MCSFRDLHDQIKQKRGEDPILMANMGLRKRSIHDIIYLNILVGLCRAWW